MGQLKSIKKWFWWHRWTSLICTLFLLLLCITGLPLIFEEEIDDWLSPTHYQELPANAPRANLDPMIIEAHRLYPKQLVTSMIIDDEEPQTLIFMAPTFKPDDKLAHSLQFDQRTGKLLKDNPPFEQQPQTFIGLMLSLHVDLFMDLPGELFLGLMGVLFVISIISGVVLYGPFMKKLGFGTVRFERSRRLKWLDLHNLLGIATAIWLLVVGITGVINEMSTPLFGLWQITDVKHILDKYKGSAIPAQNQLTSAEAAFQTAEKTLPGMEVTSLVFPGNTFGSPYHYVLWAKGKEPFTSRLFTPMLIDARTGKLSQVIDLPGYLRGLEVSRPLHFGDYGGLPLKVLWALFDVVAIIVLISGVYLWVARRKFYEDYFKRIEEQETTAV